MQIVIDIPEELYKECQGDVYYPDTGGELWQAVKNSTPLPKGHGRLIDADEYQKKINSVFPCKDRDDTNIRRATEMGLKSITTIIEADKF